MLKYLFTLPIKPKKTLAAWQKNYTEKNYEQAMILFITVSFLFMLPEIINVTLSSSKIVNYNLILLSYLDLILSTVFIWVGIGSSKQNDLNKLAKLKWINVYFITNGLLLVLANALFVFLKVGNENTYVAVTFVIQILSAYFLVLGLEYCVETSISYLNYKNKIKVFLYYLWILIFSKFLATGLSGRFWI